MTCMSVEFFFHTILLIEKKIIHSLSNISLSPRQFSSHRGYFLTKATFLKRKHNLNNLIIASVLNYVAVLFLLLLGNLLSIVDPS